MCIRLKLILLCLFSMGTLLGEQGYREVTRLSYDQTANEYQANTLKLLRDVKAKAFLSYLAPESKILDLGCGPGRDSKFFVDKGYEANEIGVEEQITPSQIALIIKDVTDKIREGKGNPLAGTNGLELYIDKKNNINFFAVKENQQTELNFKVVKKHICSVMKIDEEIKIVEIVGDSKLFSEEGTEAARNFLSDFLTDQERIIEYGYTGNINSNNSKMDANGCVTSVIKENPKRGNMTVANVISYTTPEVIEKFNCNTSPECKNFFLVIGEEEFGFGKDITLSDNLADEAICFEGGPQSFAQLMNLLENNVQIHVLLNLRDPDNFYNYDSETGKIPTFSCSEFLFLLSQEQNLNKEKVEEFIAEYFSSHVLNNKNKYDANDKANLFSAGKKKLIEQELWNKFDLLEFYNCRPPHLTKRKGFDRTG